MSNKFDQSLIIASKLLKCRDTCRKFYGSGWKEKQEEWKPIILAVMAKEKCEALQAATIIGPQLEGFSLMTCLGVISEMITEKEIGNILENLAKPEDE
jgi:hypothetical protein